ncbi:MAG: helix-turn-helix transcriptional regulator [Rhizobiaceae bacterium]|nr:helix-turn-helix transcriptional regulator [Rhizobiaceae bacterium]
MLDTTRLSALIGHIYDCVPDPARWDDVMEALCRATESEVGIISIIAPQQRKLHFGSVVGPGAATESLKGNHAQHMPALDMLPDMREGQLYRISDMTGPFDGREKETFEDSVLYREWHRKHGLSDGYCVALCKLPEEAICLDLVLGADRRPVTLEDRRQLSTLVPHIQRAGKVGMMLNTIEHQTDVMQQVTNQMANGVLIVSRNMRILAVNPLAEQMLMEGTLIRSLRGRLAVNNPAAAARIEQDVKLSSFMEDRLQGASFSIPLGDSFNPSIARVIPLARRDLDRRLVNTAAAAIFIADSKPNADLASDAFGALYALTLTEGRIARLTASGIGRASIAQMFGIKESTVKSHLESIYGKTGTSGQMALSILMRTLSPSLR